MINWAYPDLVAAGLVLALWLLLTLAYWWRGRRLGRALRRQVPHLGWKVPLRLLIGATLLLAALGPSLGVRQRPVRTVGKDIWLLVDVSRSMDATDVAPSRLLRAQAELHQLAAHFPADRVGLIVFGSEAAIQCPLTYDQQALQVFINTLQTNLLPVGPTSLQAPLELVLGRLAAATPLAAAVVPRAVAVVLVTDGEDFGENLEPALQALARTGARIYTVGVGTAAGSKVPNARGGFVRDGRGKPVLSQLRDAPLIQLASQTGGQYLELNDRQNGFGLLLTMLRNLQAPTEQVRTVGVADNHYRYPLAAALLLLALDVVLTITVIRP